MSLSKGTAMNGNATRALRAAIKTALRGANSMYSKPVAGAVALVALGAAAVVPQARAGNYTAGNATQLSNAITAANASTDPSSTITLTNSFTLPSNYGFTMPTKSITIDTQG